MEYVTKIDWAQNQENCHLAPQMLYLYCGHCPAPDPQPFVLFALVIQSPSGLKVLSSCCFLNSLLFPFAAGLVVDTASLFCLQPSVSLSSSAHWTVPWLPWRRELCSSLCPWSPKTERWGSVLTAHLHTPDSPPAPPARPALSAAGTQRAGGPGAQRRAAPAPPALTPGGCFLFFPFHAHLALRSPAWGTAACSQPPGELNQAKLSEAKC